jgi:hypothetical protein
MSDGQEVKGVAITVHVNSYAFLFGMPFLLAAIILSSVGVTYLVVKPSVMVPNLEINPKVSVNATMPAPNITVEAKNPITVTVPPIQIPAAAAPRVTVNVPPGAPPNVSVSIPEGKPGEVRLVEKIVEKRVEVPVSVYVETSDKARITMEDVLSAAEKYLSAWCKKSGKDFQVESKTWLSAWQSRVTERGGDEQRLANEVLADKRGAFDIVKAKAEEIVYLCHLMLRYRDANLAMPSAFKEAITAENLVKFKDFLDKGPGVN